MWSTDLAILKKNNDNFKIIINPFLPLIPENIKIKLIKPLSKAKIKSYKKPTAIIINIKKLNIPRIFEKIIEENPPQSIFNKKIKG